MDTHTLETKNYPNVGLSVKSLQKEREKTVPSALTGTEDLVIGDGRLVLFEIASTKGNSRERVHIIFQ